MFVSFLTGKGISRKQSHCLFKVSSSKPYNGPTDSEILNVIKKYVPNFSGQWKQFAQQEPFKKFVEYHKRRNLPTIILFAAKLNGLRKSAVHAVMVVSVASEICAIDPLGKLPKNNLWNVSFPLKLSGRIHGANYSIDTNYEIKVLDWLLK